MTIVNHARPAFRPLRLTLAAVLIATAPVAGAQVYKWVDERGVVNYGNNPPAATRGGKSPELVEDRLSVYTPDERVLEATKRERERSAQRTPGGASTPPPARPSVPAATVASPVAANAPCVSGFEPSCAGYAIYDGPVGYGSGRLPPRLNQPGLSPGAIAGNVSAGAGYTPGLSTQPPPVQGSAVVRRQAPSASFTLKQRDERSDRDRR